MSLSAPVMAWVALVTLASLIVYAWTIHKVGQIRRKHGIKAPAMIGHPELERAVRVHYNTLEQIVPHLVALWLCALFLHPWIAVALGLLWIAGRVVYAQAYWDDSRKRGPGFGIAVTATLLAAFGAFVGIVLTLARGF